MFLVHLEIYQGVTDGWFVWDIKTYKGPTKAQHLELFWRPLGLQRNSLNSTVVGPGNLALCFFSFKNKSS